MSYCHGQHLLDRAADGRDYPEPYFEVIGKMPMPKSLADMRATLSPIGTGAKPINAFDKLVPLTTKTKEKTT